MGFESDGEGNEVYTCDDCGWSVFLQGEGGDVAECPECLQRQEEAEDVWMDKHSINCIKCGELVDERNCIHAEDGEGEICPGCQLED